MAYNSAYKGSEIDAAVGAVKTKEKTWDAKMPAVTGTAGQMVGFDDSGNPVAQDVPATGLTEEAADRKYLPIGMYEVNSDTPEHEIGVNFNGGASGRIVVSPTLTRLNFGNNKEIRLNSKGIDVKSDSGISLNESSITGIKTPTADDMPANKAYVDSAASDAIPKLTIVTLPASGWDSSTKSQTIAVAGVDADETKQWIECTGVISNQSAFDDASIKITAFAENSLTFTASTVPTVDLKVGVKIEAVKDVTPYPKVYGVEWDWTSSGPTRGVRTDDAATFGDPNPAVSNGTGSSPFDNIWPWSGMVKETRNGGVEVKEPKYWFKWTKTGKKLKLQIADGPVEGFSVDPVNRDRGDGLGELDYSYIGRYHCASGYKSATGAAQQVNITRSQARSGIHNLGANFWQMDFAQFWYVNMLFLVEFADWNGERIGRGCSTSGSKMNNGQTDAMGYHTGTTAASRDSYGFTQYRNIEGWWDNVCDWMDGCYYARNGLNVINAPNNFSDSANGTLVGMPSSGYPSDFTIPTASGLEWALFPSAANGSQTTYVPDDWGSDADGKSPFLSHGGGYHQNQDSGPFSIQCYNDVDAEIGGDEIGCRLQERPPKA